MTPLSDLVSIPALRPVAQALLHFLWQGAAVALVYALAHRFLAREDPRARYALGVGALAEMRALPKPALGAGGGPLLQRIRRLVDPAAARQRPGGAGSWWAGLMVLAGLAGWVVLAGIFLPSPRLEAMPSPTPLGMTPEPVPGPAPSPAPAPQASARDSGESVSGRWNAERHVDHGRDRIYLQIERRGKGHEWSAGSTLPPSELEGLEASQGARFQVVRDAGTFLFEGGFDRPVTSDGALGSGTFRFVPEASYAPAMERLGYSVEGLEEHFAMAMHDVALDFVREIHSLGYEDVPKERLVQFRVHGVSPELIRELTALGYESVPPEALVKVRIHGATPTYVRGLQEAGVELGDLETAVKMRIHGVTPGYVAGLAAVGYPNLSPEQLVKMRIHGVNDDLVRRARERGYDDLTAQELVDLAIHGLDGYRARRSRGGGRR